MAAPAWHDSNLVYRVTQRRQVFDAVSILSTLKSPTFVWRGHNNAEWTLTPAAHRLPSVTDQQSALDSQRDLLDKARIRRHHVLDGWEMPDLALLARLQHNNAATVLMDVTTDPYVGLYFACEESSDHDDANGLLVAVDVSTRGQDPTTHHFDLGYSSDLESVFQGLGTRIGLYAPPDVSPRIMAQRGRFVFGPFLDLGYSTLPIRRPDWDAAKLAKVFSPNRGVGQPPKPAVVAIEIRSTLKPQLRDILEQSFGLSAVTLFPDFHGFAAAHRVV